MGGIVCRVFAGVYTVFSVFQRIRFFGGMVLVVEVLTWRAIENLQPLTQISSGAGRHVVEGA